MSIEEYPIESNVHHPVAVRLNGTAHLTGVMFAIMVGEAHPVLGDFQAAVVLSGKTGVMTGGRSVKGVYQAWVRVTDVSPELPWIDAGPIFRLT